MPFQDRIASRMVPVAAVLSLVPLLFTAWAVRDVHRVLPETRQRSLAVHALIGQIDRLDEALTATARLAAATGAAEWEARYADLDGELDAVLDSLSSVASAVNQPGIAEALGIAAGRLELLERNALRLVQEGQGDRAVALLQSDTYAEAKADFAAQSTALLGGLAAWTRAEEARVEERLGAVVAMAGLSFLILLFVWGYSAYLLRWRDIRRREVEASLLDRVEEQERLEGELRAAEERLRVIVDVAPVAIIRVDRERTVQYWNAAAERMFGWSADEVLGRPYPLLSPEHWPDADRLFQKGLAGETIEGIETRRLKKDGTEAHLRMWNAVVRDADGDIEGLVDVFADVSEQQALELRLRQSEKLEAIGRLAGGIAHDFNNVMTAVQGHSDLLLESLGPRDPMRGDIEEIRTNAARATALTRQLLAFSRRQVLQPRALHLGAVARGIEGMLGRLLGDHIRLEIQEEEDVGVVEADPTQIEQVIVNLAVNARDAMPQGGVLGIAIRNAALTEEEANAFDYAVEAGPYVRLLIWDTGEGMDEETRKQVFEPFFTTKPTGRGTGLGMATVFGIIKQSGGYVWVRSAPGDGTEVEVLLPRAKKATPSTPPGSPAPAGSPTPSAAPESAAPPASAAPPGAAAPAGVAGSAASPAGSSRAAGEGGETLLVVEDDDAVRSLTVRILEGRGYDVITAAAPAAALDLLEAGKVPSLDLLITDMMLPGMSGQELAVRVTDRFPGVPVIFMSGYTEDEVLLKDVAAGASVFLPKPFSPGDLAGTVRKVLDELGG